MGETKEAVDQCGCNVIPFRGGGKNTSHETLCLLIHVYMQMCSFIFKDFWMFPKVLTMATSEGWGGTGELGVW